MTDHSEAARRAHRPFGEAHDLNRAEQFVLWAFRQRFADGEPESAALQAGFHRMCGLSGIETALRYFEQAFVLTVAHATRELGLLFPPCNRRLSADEMALLSLCAAEQGGFEAHAQAMACALVGSVHHARLREAMGAFLSALLRLGLRLRLDLRALESAPKMPPGSHVRPGSASFH
jgi:hypothetical protein